MRSFLLFLCIFCLSDLASYAQIDWKSLEMGSSPKEWQGKLTDISNPNTLDEKTFTLNEEVDFYGLKSKKVDLGFYNDRLFTITFTFAPNEWDKLKEVLQNKIDPNGKINESKKEGYWYKEKAQFAVFASNNETKLYYTDNSQKDFHWKDLFQGTVFYVLITIIGLAVLWFVLAWLWTSYCPKCRSFAMEHIKRNVQTRTINTGTLVEQMLGSGEVEMRFKYVDYYRCKKCGHETKYKYKSTPS